LGNCSTAKGKPADYIQEFTEFVKANTNKIAALKLKKWFWCALGNYAYLSRGRFSIRPRNDPRYYNGSYPFIQIGDLPKDGGFLTNHSKTLNEKGLRVSKQFNKNTIAIAIVGATIGNTGILSYKTCFPDSL
jgi:type I restriction enzyme, S subunit